MIDIPDNEIIDIIRRRYNGDRDIRYNDIFREFIKSAQELINDGQDREDALTTVENFLISLGLDRDNREDEDLLANFIGDIDLNLHDRTINESLFRLLQLSGIKKD